MEIRHLRYFLAVAEEGNVTRAAERLHISQPPLSQQIKDLERTLGVSLFARSQQGMTLTAAGEAFRVEAHRIVQAAEHAKRVAVRASTGETGTLRVGFTGSSAFNPVVAGALREFRRRWPEVEVQLEEANTTRLTEGMVHRKLDAAFLRPASNEMPDLQVHRFKDERMKIALPSSHPLAGLKRVALHRLAHDSFVLFPRHVGLSLHDAIIGACQAAGFEPRIGQESPQLSSVINLVAADLGVSVVPASLTQIQLKGVSYLDILGPAPVATLGLAIHRSSDNPTVHNLWQVARNLPRTEVP
jgi:DNA-binding transcriptional LysR family regulator